MEEPTKQAIDLLSISTVIAALLGAMPHIGAALSVIWLAIRIWETETVQKLFGKKKDHYAE